MRGTAHPPHELALGAAGVFAKHAAAPQLVNDLVALRLWLWLLPAFHLAEKPCGGGNLAYRYGMTALGDYLEGHAPTAGGGTHRSGLTGAGLGESIQGCPMLTHFQ